jgi:hypothetical protein
VNEAIVDNINVEEMPLLYPPILGCHLLQDEYYNGLLELSLY